MEWVGYNIIAKIDELREFYMDKVKVECFMIKKCRDLYKNAAWIAQYNSDDDKTYKNSYDFLIDTGKTRLNEAVAIPGLTPAHMKEAKFDRKNFEHESNMLYKKLSVAFDLTMHVDVVETILKYGFDPRPKNLFYNEPEKAKKTTTEGEDEEEEDEVEAVGKPEKRINDKLKNYLGITK